MAKTFERVLKRDAVALASELLVTNDQVTITKKTALATYQTKSYNYYIVEAK